MADIVVTEFMDLPTLTPLKALHVVHVDAQLWNKPAELEALLATTRGLIVRNRTQVTASLIEKAPKLQVVGRLGVGLDNIDLDACKARRIAVCPATGANAVSVAEYVISTALVLSRFAAYNATAALIAGEWPREKSGTGRELAGQRLGIIGYGNIGQTVAQRARAMGMTISAFDEYVPVSSSAWKDTERLDIDALLATSDVVTLHCPLTPETRNLINAERLAFMKKGALLIDTARGGIVNEAALANSLKCGHLGGAAIDVFTAEPIDEATGALFVGVPNLILTPHIAGVTTESNERISTVTVANVMKVLKDRA
jgi:(S)-sulfolactate dehydrogenase